MRTRGSAGEPRPSRSTAPASGASRPVVIAMVVDFPAPFGPSRPKTSPARTSSERPSTAVVAPKRLRMSRRVSKVAEGTRLDRFARSPWKPFRLHDLCPRFAAESMARWALPHRSHLPPSRGLSSAGGHIHSMHRKSLDWSTTCGAEKHAARGSEFSRTMRARVRRRRGPRLHALSAHCFSMRPGSLALCAPTRWPMTAAASPGCTTEDLPWTGCRLGSRRRPRSVLR